MLPALSISKVCPRVLCSLTSVKLSLNGAESKLLKPATEYILGRKDKALRLNHKQISHDHLSFTVGEYSEKDSVSSSGGGRVLYILMCLAGKSRVQAQSGVTQLNIQTSEVM